LYYDKKISNSGSKVKSHFIKAPNQNSKNALQLKATQITPPRPADQNATNGSEVFPVNE
jgi:hypothetical protein